MTTDWKPTEEMLDIAMTAYGKSPLPFTAALIAVQPYIARQAAAEALEKAAQYLNGAASISSSTLAQSVYNSAADMLRAMIEKEPQG